MSTDPDIPAAEKYLRERYGAYRGHISWRQLEEAFNAGHWLIPEGYALVPVEPTAPQLQAALDMSRDYGQDDAPLERCREYWAAGEVYKAMISAAPKPIKEDK